LKSAYVQQKYAPSFIHIDSTHSLNALHYPTVLIATTDLKRTSRLIAIACTKKEGHEEFSFIMNTLSSKLHEFFDFRFQPTHIMSDSALGIIQGCRTAFGFEYTHNVCFFHLMQNVNTQIKGYSKADQDSLQEDMHIF